MKAASADSFKELGNVRKRKKIATLGEDGRGFGILLFCLKSRSYNRLLRIAGSRKLQEYLEPKREIFFNGS